MTTETTTTLRLTTAADLGATIRDALQVDRAAVSDDAARTAMHALGLSRYEDLTAGDVEQITEVVLAEMTTAADYTQQHAARLAREVDKGGFSDEAIAWAEETGSDIEVDVARMLLGLTVEDFRAECEDQADEDRLPGIADYVSAVAACAARARGL